MRSGSVQNKVMYKKKTIFIKQNFSLYFTILTAWILASCGQPASAPTLFSTVTQSAVIATLTPTSISQSLLTGTNAVVNQIGCTLPVQISNLNIRYFYWGEDAKSILFKEKNGQVWYRYGTVSGQTTVVAELPVTPTPDYAKFSVSNYKEIFISPSLKLILFTRGAPEKYEMYYRSIDEKQEHYLGEIRGYIKKVDWFNNEKNAIVAMDWQAPVGPNAHIYSVDFSKNELTIEMPKMDDYKNIEYLGLTPDATRLMFVSYLNKVHLDRTVKLWNISTHEITSTPIFNPLSFKWISVSQNPNKFSFVSVLLYDIDTSETVYLADAKYSIDPFIRNGLISPDGTSVAYIENETDNLYWTVCKHNP